ncbi:pentatricopeptide repeat-containing protein At1g31920 [Apium graveolens]|uniref:pentatricopeptide repeat-containing protein At1g31920 n=1 Tax=Apium graveolens TaxID=4045 RepID=UPI003D79EAE2
MVKTSVLHQPHLLIQHEDHLQSQESISLKLKEQECVSLSKKCSNLKELKQVHCHIVKFGLFCSSLCSSNLLLTCVQSSWCSMDYACSIFNQIDDPGSFQFNMMIRGYVKDMNFDDALFIYHHMLDMDVVPDNFTYPFILKACARLRDVKKGVQIHGHVFKFGYQDDVFIQNSLINFYGKCEELRECCGVFEKMEQRSVASWSAFIAAHARNGLWAECLSIFRNMIKEGCWRPEESILVSVLSACTKLGDYNTGQCTHGNLIRNLSGQNVVVETSLLDMYLKCGYHKKGLYLFNSMVEKNHLTYSVMISGLATNGCSAEALMVFSKMLEEGLEPDDVVYVSVLSACGHAGLVEKGLQLFNRIKNEHTIEPTIQHYGCLVDLLSRAGRLDEALEVIKNMPMEPNDVVWRSLLGACKTFSNIQLGEIAAEKLMQMKPTNASDYLVLSHIYAEAQRWKDVAITRTKIAEIGLTQTPGFSCVEVKKKMYKFVSQDMTWPQCNGVYDMLHQMEWQLKFEGYSADTSQVLLDVDEEEKMERLSRHSQKLAIAFALIHTSEGSPIRIVRNLKMCDDCHTYTKLISRIYERKIVVRDRNFFHHFEDGSCSCRDYW